jgi:hypothetical protein
MRSSARRKLANLIETSRKRGEGQLRSAFYALTIVMAATAVMLMIGELVALDHVGIGYVMPSHDSSDALGGSCDYRRICEGWGFRLSSFTRRFTVLRFQGRKKLSIWQCS